MAVISKIDAYNARVRDAMILPFKRKMASLTIRTDIWKGDLGPKAAQTDAQQDARSKAQSAMTEVDEHVVLLMDLKLPGEKKARASEAEVQTLLEDFAAMRLTLSGLAATAT